MRILVVYDRKDSVRDAVNLPEDFGAEYDDEASVDGIVGALERGGHSSERLSLDENIVDNLRGMRPDLVFNIAEGIRGRGRESLVPALLDFLDVPYTGSDAAALAISLDKAVTKRIASACGVRTPPFKVIDRVRDADDVGLEYPLFVKPVGEGSSMGIRHGSLVNDTGELRGAAEWILAHYRQGCMVEEFAPGREYCVGVLGNREPMILPIVEVETSGSFYSYEEKSAHSKRLVCPADIPECLADEMTGMAMSIFTAIGCRDLARADFKVDRDGQASFLEINPLPGLAESYGIFPHQARAAGIEYDDLVNRIATLAMERGKIS